MAIIYSYPTLSNPTGDDLLLVSDVSAQGKPTKNITISQLISFIPGMIPGGGTVTSVGLDFQTTGLTTGGLQTETITGAGTFDIAGTLVQAHGGTGMSAYTPGDVIYAGAAVLSALPIGGAGEVLTVSAGYPAWVAPTTGTVTSVQLSIATGMGLAWNVLSGANPITDSGNLELDGTLALNFGGTAGATQQAGLDNLTDAVSGAAGQVLTTDGLNASWSTLSTGVTTIDFGSVGLTPNVATSGAIVVGGTLVIGSGGTGVSSWVVGDTGSIMYYDDALSSTQFQKLPTTGRIQGDYLTLDAGLLPEWTTVSPAGVGGAGTLNQMSKWTSGSTIGDALMIDDGDTVSLGAATVATQKFRVVSDYHPLVTNQAGYFENAHNTVSGSGLIGLHNGGGPVANYGVWGQGANSTTANYGVYGSATAVNATAINVGGHFQASSSAVNNYSLRLEDGTEQIGYFLKCIDADGNANWGEAVGTTYTFGTALTDTAGNVDHDDYGVANTYTYPTSITTNAQGHVTAVTAGVERGEKAFSPFPIYQGAIGIGASARSLLIQSVVDASFTCESVKWLQIGGGAAKAVTVAIYTGDLTSGVGVRRVEGEILSVVTGINTITFNDAYDFTAGDDIVIYFSMQNPTIDPLGLTGYLDNANTALGRSGSYNGTPAAALADEIALGFVSADGTDRVSMHFYGT